MAFSNFKNVRADLQFLKTFLNYLKQLAAPGMVEKDFEPQMVDSGSDMVDLGSDVVDLGSDMVDFGSDTVDQSRMVVAQCYVLLVPRMAAPTFRSH